MKTKLFVLATTLSCTILLNSCEEDFFLAHCKEGKGESVEKTFEVSSFTGIELSSSFQIVVQQGNNTEVKAVGQENIINDLKLKMKNGTMLCDLEESCYRNYNLTLYVTTPNINSLKITGSGNIIMEDFSNQGNLKTEITGSGDIFLNSSVGTQKLDAIISGSGDIVANKNMPVLNNVNVKISGSGSFRAYPLVTESCSVTIFGSGNCYNTVNSELTVTITGSGNVYYKGKPYVDSKCSGSGKVVSTEK